MVTRTRTGTSHWHVQTERRKKFLEGWRENRRTVVRYQDLEWHDTARRMREAVYMGEDGGAPTRTLDAVLHEVAPGTTYGQSMHRHPGEAWLYVVEGRGHSYLGVEPTGGQIVEWETGDLVVVDHYMWHQHFNDVPDEPSRLVRIHAFASMLETMRALLDPLPLFEEMLDTGPDVGQVDWPEDVRPA